MNQEQLEERRGERERQRAPSGKAHDRLSLPEQPTARPLCGMCCCLEDTSGPSKNEEGFGGKGRRGDTHCWPVDVHKQGVVFETGRVVFQTGMLFPVRDEGVVGWGLSVSEKPPLSGFLPTEFSLQLAVWCLVKEESEPLSPRVSHP